MNTPRSTSSSLAAPALLVLATTFPACTVPQFEAVRDVQRSHSADGLLSLRCSTHNGPIRIRGKAGQKTIEVAAQLSARGFSEQEAKDNVAQLDIAIERDGTELVIRGVEPTSFDWRNQASFAYTIELPNELMLKLQSHNGDLEVLETAGNLSLETHNGDIDLRASSGKLVLVTHNGAIEVAMTGTGPVGGSVETHNGSVAVEFGGRAAVVDASTHNGSIDAKGGVVTGRDDNSLRFVTGDGGAPLKVTTHNGGVRLSASAK